MCFLTPLNIRHILLATAPLALVTMAQFNVLMVRGFDVSVGAVISLTVVIGSFLMAEDMNAGLILFGALVCLAVGIAVGLTNGVLVRRVGINSVITTIAMLSVVQGIALYLRPSPFGVISEDFIDFFQTRVGFIPASFFVILAAAVAGDIWLYRTRSGLKLRAVGFREEAAKRNGVRVDFVHIRAFFLSAVVAVLSGFFVGSEVGVGTPIIGSSYTLTSIAAAVLGGAALTGGRGSFVGGLLGALFFTLVDQHHHTARAQHRRGHHDERGADADRGDALFRVRADPARLGAHLRCMGTIQFTAGSAMNDFVDTTAAATPALRAVLPARGSLFQMRFMAIWIAIVGLIVVCAVIVPRSLLPSTFLAIIPLAAFLGIAAIGETLVLMARGIDLSIPAVITLSSTIVLGFSAGHDDAISGAVLAALFFRNADWPHQRIPDRSTRTQCADCHSCGRRNHRRRHSVVSRLASAGVARASGDGRVGRCAVSRHQLFGLDARRRGDHPQPRTAEDDNRAAFFGGRCQSAGGVDRRH